ncbi:MAG: hypothetical protein EOO77_20690 [Oxalobacteraceae bacterium]|nr:MAG: hypothetical protein EOO77_20690 [Oxalobacteraceae bacterium]
MADEIDLYLKTLSAIVELNPDWVGTLFASEEETKDLRKAKEGEIYVMRYIKEESKRTPVAVQSDWIVEGPLSEPLYGTGVPTPSSVAAPLLACPLVI